MNILKLFLVFISLSILVSASSTILVLDASGSMDEYSGNSTKMTIAKQAAYEFLDNVKYGDEVALIVYYDCDDIVTEVPFTTNMQSIKTKIASVEAESYTPIAASITYAASYAQSSGRSGAGIIILTDGEETCDSQSDAVTAAQTAVTGGPIKIINVVGFDISSSSTGYTNLQQIAQAGGGKYYPANDADELSSSLTQAYDDSSGVSCCGPMFMLLGLVGASVFFGRN
ncbi:MAG: vWA domain-containing protein [Candidatus Micrarchaeota archaeon]